MLKLRVAKGVLQIKAPPVSLPPDCRNRPELIIFPKFLLYEDDEETRRRAEEGACLISEKQERIKWK